MKHILLVIPSLNYGGAARQLTLLAAALPRERFQPWVCVLGEPTPWVKTLQQAGVAVEVLGWKRPFDVAPFLALRKLLQSIQPAVVHVWGKAALAAVVLSGARGASRLFASYVLEARKRADWPSRWLLQRVDRVIAFGQAEAVLYWYWATGLAKEKRVTVVAPAAGLGERGVLTPRSEESTGEVTPPARQILCIGPIERHKGFQEAVWAFDILHYLFEDLRLVFVGDGTDRPRVEAFARAIGAWRSIQFVGSCSDLTPLLRQATLVWVPSRKGGVGAAQEAMAAGRPVVASRIPELAEIIVEGETGYLVPPGDKAALARQTRWLLEDAALARRLGEAGQRRTAEAFSLARLVEQCAGLYEG